MTGQETDSMAELHLASAEYRQVVAPALAAAAETAAERGDPQLFNDMASMLALGWMVEGLVVRYRDAVSPAQRGSSEESLDAAPLGACALVFTESELDEATVSECLGALRQASRLLVEDRVHEAGREALDGGWQALRNDEHDQAIESLRDCARAMAHAVDRWEEARSNTN
jgi:hypothetical protein